MGFLSFDMAYVPSYNKFMFDIYHLETYEQRFGDHIVEGEICIIPQHFSEVSDNERVFRGRVKDRHYILHMDIDTHTNKFEIIRAVIAKIELMNFKSVQNLCTKFGIESGINHRVYQKTIIFRYL